MELPIAKQSYEPTTEALVRAVKRARATLADAVAEQTQFDGAVAWCNPDRKMVRCANFATDISAIDDQLLGYFNEHGTPCYLLECAAERWPDDVAEAARSAGYTPRTRALHLMRHYQAPTKINDQLQILPARSIYGQLQCFYVDFARKGHGLDGDSADQLAGAMIDLLDEPRLELFLGRLDKTVVGAAGVISLGNIGVIHPAYTDPNARGQGVAASLMAATIEHCSRAQFEQVVIDRSVGCDSIPFYESLGFQRIAEYDQYILP